MKKNLCSYLILAFGCGAVFSGCARSYTFKDAAPVQTVADTTPSALPHKTDFNFVEYSVSSSVRYPLVSKLDTRRNPRSADVNSMDELPASSWYTPRLGYKKISSEEMLKGPSEAGEPQAPLKVLKAKDKGNSPGFLVEDARGKKYLIKLDQADYPNLESTVNLVTNRLFWAFGYNVPEDYLFHFTAEDLNVPAELQDKVDEVLSFAATDENGAFPSTASLFVKGIPLGPVEEKGTRHGDSNDTIPHENMRVLRALRVFCAFLDHSGMRSDNSLDAYVGEDGKGHTVHYLLDFGEAMGVHGVEKDRPWDGFEYFFSPEDTVKNFMTLGIALKPWEKLNVVALDPKGSFESEAFEFRKWKETTQYVPIRRSRPEDDYWAAKIIAKLTEENLEKLFSTAGYPDKSHTQYLIRTLLARREKILKDVYSRVSPLEVREVKNGRLELKDLGLSLWPEAKTAYEVRFYSRKGWRLGKMTLEAGKDGVSVPLEDAWKSSKGYLRADVRAVRDGKKSRPAEFHLQGSDNSPHLSAIVH